ncbi:MAG: hemolysin family protein [Candidatus Margulisiibacteriota bacterium]
MELFILLIIIALLAFFNAAETAITAIPRIKVGRLVEQNAIGAKSLQRLKEKPSEFFSTILMMQSFLSIAAGTVATAITVSFFHSKGLVNEGLALGVATGVMTFLLLIFGEITPKTLAIRRTESFALFIAPIVVVFQIILNPLAHLVGYVSRPVIFLFGGKAPERTPFVTEEDIRLILKAGAEEGVIEKEEREMITSIFDFGDTVAREVMTPRPDIVAVEADQSMDRIIKAIVDCGHSRLPVYEGNLDNIIGVVYAKDLLKARRSDIREFLRPAIFIPETKKISELLHEMQAARTHFAVIIDEYGMNSGIVTMEDIIEEIVGEIHDEFEREEKSFVRVDETTTLLDGRMSVSDVNRQLKIALPEEEYDTMGGLVFGKLGKAPAVGDTFRFSNLIISVERIHRRRITRIKIVKLPKRIEEEVQGR